MGAPRAVVLIMAGGSGTRFWPLSRKSLPKQYLALRGSRSLIQQTVDRITTLELPVYVCSHQSHEAILREQLPEVECLLEPLSRNTTACLLYSVAVLLERFDRETVVVALPADHFIEHADYFREVLRKAIEFAKGADGIVTMGIKPTGPHTGYGYIQAGEPAKDCVFRVKRFVEKPSVDHAEEFLASGDYYWNSGMFVGRMSVFCRAFERFVSNEWKTMQSAVRSSTLAGAVESAYANLASVPIDVAVMEKADNIFVIEAENIGWTDLGSWNALYETLASSRGEVVIQGARVKNVKSEGCLVRVPSGKKVALVGVKNLIIVEEGDTILIADRSEDQRVREVAAEFDA